jgi:flagellar motility protein MotE (MotC chaperone)
MEQKPEQPHLKAFVLMPFDSEFDKIFNELIKPALEEPGYDVNRADSIFNQQNILKDIVRGIAEADLVVADLTSLNPNVFYELGIAHAMHKPTVPLTQSIEEVPFDLRSYRIIRYSLDFVEAPKLLQSLKVVAENAKSGKVDFGNPVTDFHPKRNGVEFSPATTAEKAIIEAEGEREVETKEEEKGLLDFIVDGEKSLREIAKHTEQMTKATNEVSEKIQQRTAERKKIAQMPGATSQIHRIYETIAKDLTMYAKKLEEEHPELLCAWESFDENTTGLIQTAQIRTKKDKEAGLKFRSSMEKFLSEIRNALKIVQKFREDIAGMKGISREVNRAFKMLDRALDLVIADLKVGDSFCTKELTLLDEKIEEEDVHL